MSIYSRKTKLVTCHLCGSPAATGHRLWALLSDDSDPHESILEVEYRIQYFLTIQVETNRQDALFLLGYEGQDWQLE
jgi:hypothetical protein